MRCTLRICRSTPETTSAHCTRDTRLVGRDGWHHFCGTNLTRRSQPTACAIWLTDACGRRVSSTASRLNSALNLLRCAMTLLSAHDELTWKCPWNRGRTLRATCRRSTTDRTADRPRQSAWTNSHDPTWADLPVANSEPTSERTADAIRAPSMPYIFDDPINTERTARTTAAPTTAAIAP